tara:strand:+ start:920 stop:1228 length:309 start_codon:yes stop_codon:yes gene_type:complete
MTIEPIKEKLDDKIAKLNSSRVIKKITPRGDISWYIKWVSSMFIIFAMATASADMYPYNLFLQFIGLVGWLIVGMLWHDRALIFLNAFGIAIILSGIMNYFI